VGAEIGGLRTQTGAFVSVSEPVGFTAEMTSPPAGSVLPGATVTFVWSAGVNVSQYYLKVGTVVNTGDIYEGDQGLNTAATISGLPVQGGDVYVRLSSRIGQDWTHRDYTYRAFGVPITPVPGTWLNGNIGFNVSRDGTKLTRTGSALQFGAALIGAVPTPAGLTTSFFYDDIPISGGRFRCERDSTDGSIEITGEFTSPTRAQGRIREKGVSSGVPFDVDITWVATPR
jgi:hypothetical protein